MRDFTAGRDINVDGNVQIIDNSNQPKFLTACTIEELVHERAHRKQLLRRERKAKWKRLALAWVGIVIMLGSASLWFYFDGKKELSSLVLGLGGLAVGLASVKVLEKPNDFEQRQIETLYEIRMILRERGAEQ